MPRQEAEEDAGERTAKRPSSKQVLEPTVLLSTVSLSRSQSSSEAPIKALIPLYICFLS
jgi:hypothetical protein